MILRGKKTWGNAPPNFSNSHKVPVINGVWTDKKQNHKGTKDSVQKETRNTMETALSQS